MPEIAVTAILKRVLNQISKLIRQIEKKKLPLDRLQLKKKTNVDNVIIFFKDLIQFVINI